MYGGIFDRVSVPIFLSKAYQSGMATSFYQVEELSDWGVSQ